MDSRTSLGGLAHGQPSREFDVQGIGFQAALLEAVVLK
jgi:hypothetical protein